LSFHPVRELKGAMCEEFLSKVYFDLQEHFRASFKEVSLAICIFLSSSLPAQKRQKLAQMEFSQRSTADSCKLERYQLKLQRASFNVMFQK